jgi:membrane protease YdiL (CAAX protease family)
VNGGVQTIAASAPREGVELGSRRILHTGPLRWLRAVAWALALLAAVFAASEGVEVAATLAVQAGALGEEPPVLAGAPLAGPSVLGVVVAGSLSGLLLYALLVGLGEARAPREIAPLPAVWEIPIGLVMGAGIFAAVMAFLALAGLYDVQPAPLRSAWTATALSVGSGVVEEVLFRAVLLRLVWRAFGFPWSIALSAALFGVLHLVNPHATLLAAGCIALEAGVLLGGLYALTGRIWLSIGVHTAWNFTQGWVFGAVVSGVDLFVGGPFSSTPRAGAPDWITGGAFGPEASPVSVLVCGPVAALLLWLAWRRGRLAPQP